MNALPLTIVGNLTDDPELRYTPTGTAIVKFTVAHTPRTRDAATDTWRDGEPTFLDCTAWRQQAENIAQSLTKGARVLVAGRLRTERWQPDDGPKRSRLVLDVDAIGPELSYATATITKLRRHDGPTDDPWSTAEPAPAADL